MYSIFWRQAMLVELLRLPLRGSITHPFHSDNAAHNYGSQQNNISDGVYNIYYNQAYIF